MKYCWKTTLHCCRFRAVQLQLHWPWQMGAGHGVGLQRRCGSVVLCVRSSSITPCTLQSRHQTPINNQFKTTEPVSRCARARKARITFQHPRACIDGMIDSYMPAFGATASKALIAAAFAALHVPFVEAFAFHAFNMDVTDSREIICASAK